MKNSAIFVILLVELSLASAYTPAQQTTIDGMRLSFELGIAYQQAQQGQNVATFNSLVDQYNAWVRQNFGEDANLLMSKIITASGAPITVPSSLAISPNLMGVIQRRPFNASSDLSKFGKQQVMTQIPPGSQENVEANAADWILKNF
jgi:hypothetical protein